MNKLILKILRLSVILISAFTITLSASAQKTPVDSLVTVLTNLARSINPDSLSLISAANVINKTPLDQDQILKLEKAGELFNQGADHDFSYLIKYKILESLCETNKYEAIDYGRSVLKSLESSHTPRLALFEILFLDQLRLPYRNSDRLSDGFVFYTELLNKYTLDNNVLAMAECHYVLGGFYRTTGIMDPAIYNMKKSVSLLDSTKLVQESYFDLVKQEGRARMINNLGVIGYYYHLKGDYHESLKINKQALKQAYEFYSSGGKYIHGGDNLLLDARQIAETKIELNELDSVEYYIEIAEESIHDSPDPNILSALYLLRALYYTHSGELEKADSLITSTRGLVSKYNIDANSPWAIIAPDYYAALVHIERNQYKEAIDLLKKDIQRVQFARPELLQDYLLLARLYEKSSDKGEAAEYYKRYIELKDEVSRDQEKYRTISFELEQQIKDNEINIANLKNESRISSLTRNYSIGIAILLLLILLGIYQRFNSKKKANQILEKTLLDLQAAQSQLIHSEKMASLGELTAGIAHEIQNPLNFVNNFSEVSSDLIEELKEELQNGATEEVDSIANDLKQNLEKISHHGTRASNIVKSMLVHSRIGSGEKQPTDLRALADEYLRLAYHGLRAKDNSFNAEFSLDADQGLPEVMVVPQDIGRVLLNLINNAFYAVSEKAKQEDADYKPTVVVGVHQHDDIVEISVKDNGNGIPDSVKEKIFQPFFTTKPTGQGTGLGLSMSYDIVTNGHGGTLTVETQIGKGTEFKIRLTH